VIASPGCYISKEAETSPRAVRHFFETDVNHLMLPGDKSLQLNIIRHGDFK